LFRVPLFIAVGKEHLGVDVLSKAIRTLLKFGRARGVLGLDAEVESESKSKQGPVVGWQGSVSTEVMACEVTRVVDQDMGR
jgi:hypothetical protein